MARWFGCPYLGVDVELTDEREAHILERHADLGADLHRVVSETLATPDLVQRSASFEDRLLLSRWYDDLRGGKYVLVVVAVQPTSGTRAWIMTAYMLRAPVPGEVLWRRS